MVRDDQGGRGGQPADAPRAAPPSWSDSVWAQLDHAPVPDTAPDDLAAFVWPLHCPEGLVDWAMTPDAVAFGDHDLPRRFVEWQATWQHRWSLGSCGSLQALQRLLAIEHPALAAESAVALRCLTDAAGPCRPGARVAPDELDGFVAVFARVREFLAERDATGFGVVDASPGGRRTGLAHTWSSVTGDHAVIATADLTVRTDPHHGLCVDAPDLELVDVVEVEFGADATFATTADGRRAELAIDRSAPLAWIAPGTTHYRVRRVPEVVVWAELFAGLDDGAAAARRIGATVVFCRHGRERLALAAAPRTV